MIEVETPEGIVEFPDGTSQEVMRSALSKRFGASMTRHTDPNLGVVSDLPGGGWDQRKAEYNAGIDPLSPASWLGPLGSGMVRGAGDFTRGLLKLGGMAFNPQADTGEAISRRIEEMLPEPANSTPGKIGQVAGTLAMSAPLAFAGGPGMGVASGLGRVGVEAGRGALLGAAGNPENQAQGAAIGGAFGGAGQGLAEGLGAARPLAVDLMRRFMGADDAIARTATSPLPGTTPTAVAESLLDTGAMTGGGLREAAAARYAQAGQDISVAANSATTPIPIEQLLPASKRIQMGLGLKGEAAGDLALTETLSASGTVLPRQAQAFKQAASGYGREAGVDPAMGELFREAAGRSDEALAGAVPGYSDLMAQSQLAQAAKAASQTPNRLASEIAGGAARIGLGGASAAAGMPWWVTAPVVAGTLGRGGRQLGETGILTGLQAMNKISGLSGYPWAASAESTSPLWFDDEAQP